MGSLYRPKYRAADGTLKESAIIWLKYRDALGVLRREASGTDKEQEARRLLKQREGAAVEGRVIVPRKAITLTSADVTAYRVQRQAAGAAAATVNRELAALKRMFSLAVKGERFQRMPYIEMLRENNARRGFFEREQFESVRGHLPEYARPAAT